MHLAAKAHAVIHGHFYQPPRENPWTEQIELQPSAGSFHDWNARIHSECYRANAFARINGADQRVHEVVNNYRWMSFNIGPTLLSWMEVEDPETYRRILDADLDSRARLGHGNAMAQAYNHMILPLASPADLATQVRWGVEDFRYRFNRAPEGMWLPECAANLETLSVLEQHGIRFTVLSPYQAERVRPLGSGQPWRDVGDGSIDPSRAYRCYLDRERKRSIAIFFYDGPVSHSISFQGVLQDARRFVDRFTQAWAPARRHNQIVHVANDGETYGHHFRFGDMSLAYALRRILPEEGYLVSNYATYLEAHPPDHEVEIKAGPDGLGTAWSCAHGTLRWQEDCGCSTGGQPGWNQKWRKPLRAALDWLRDRVGDVLNEVGPRHFKDPWGASDRYIGVVLRRSRTAGDRFLSREGRNLAVDDDRSCALRLMEMRRHAMLMYTSCGWFFADLSGIETVQCLQFAARAMELAESFAGVRLKEEFLSRLDRARSNVPEWGSGRKVWQRGVEPARMDAERIAAHYAVSDLVHRAPDRLSLYRATIVRRQRAEHATPAPAGRPHAARVVLNRLELELSMTREPARLLAACLRLGPRRLVCTLTRDHLSQENFDFLEARLRDAVLSHDGSELGERRLRRLLTLCVGKQQFGLDDLLPDHRLRILEWLSRDVVAQLGAAYLELYSDNLEAIESFRKAGMPPPREFALAAEYALQYRLDQILREHHVAPAGTVGDGRVPPLAEGRALVEEVGRLGVAADAPPIQQRLSTLLLAGIDALGKTWDVRVAGEIQAFLQSVRQASIPVDLRSAQDRFARAILRESAAADAQSIRAFAGRSRIRRVLEGVALALGFAPEALDAAMREARATP